MDIKSQLIETGKYLKNNKLAWGTSGNLSARLDEGYMQITASGTIMEDLTEHDFVEINVESGKVIGTKRASKETPFHLGIYQNRPDINVVLHSSPLYTTLFSCSEERIPSNLFIETMYYLERIAYVDYHHPGTQQLADAITEKSKEANIIVMKNHGVVVFDTSFAEAKMRLETLELACEMLIKAKSAGIELNGLPQKVVMEFLEESKYKPRQRIEHVNK
ncbi:class II aldolase/adducin family protein [Terribacillus aidingensis]|uniref:class II aldolase/adducin family protein n=1 Tax=Terribacillus aidingensis TaxID=586416 RepID=UPI00344C17E4